MLPTCCRDGMEYELPPVPLPVNESSGSSRVVQPLPDSRPNINQLLAAEDAKASATQAGAQVAPTGQVQQPPAPQASPWQRPADTTQQGVDPNSISL
jgi:hypothetical protein